MASETKASSDRCEVSNEGMNFSVCGNKSNNTTAATLYTIVTVGIWLRLYHRSSVKLCQPSGC